MGVKTYGAILDLSTKVPFEDKKSTMKVSTPAIPILDKQSVRIISLDLHEDAVCLAAEL